MRGMLLNELCQLLTAGFDDLQPSLQGLPERHAPSHSSVGPTKSARIKGLIPMKSGKVHHVSFTSPIVSDIKDTFNLDSVSHRFVRAYCVTIISLGSNRCVHVEN